jgi:hypothetical protein
MTPEYLQKIISKAKHPLNINDLFQVDYFSHGYETNRIIHTILGFYKKFIQLEEVHGVILENTMRIIQENERTEIIKPWHEPYKSMFENTVNRNLETQIIFHPEEGLEIVDLTRAEYIRFGVEVSSYGIMYYNCEPLAKSAKEMQKKLQAIRAAKGFTDKWKDYY